MSKSCLRQPPVAILDFGFGILLAYTGIMKIELELEDDGRWIAEVREIPGALVYGSTRDEAIHRVEALILRILADRIENGEAAPELKNVFTVAA